MKKFIAMLLALVMALSLVACGGGDSNTSGDDSATGDKIVKIGVFEPTSGQNAGGGKKEILGIEYANSIKPTVTINGEEYTVQLVYADNASDSAKAPTAAQTLISQGVSVVIGTYGSGCAIAAVISKEGQAPCSRTPAFLPSALPAPTLRSRWVMISTSVLVTSIPSRAL